MTKSHHNEVVALLSQWVAELQKRVIALEKQLVPLGDEDGKQWDSYNMDDPSTWGQGDHSLEQQMKEALEESGITG